jgi:hypothetical protein
VVVFLVLNVRVSDMAPKIWPGRSKLNWRYLLIRAGSSLRIVKTTLSSKPDSYKFDRVVLEDLARHENGFSQRRKQALLEQHVEC